MTFPQRLRELLARATPGPWKVDPANVGNTHILYRNPSNRTDAKGILFDNTDDPALIELLQNSAPALLALVEAAEALSACIGEGNHLTDDERQGLSYLRTAPAAIERSEHADR